MLTRKPRRFAVMGNSPTPTVQVSVPVPTPVTPAPKPQPVPRGAKPTQAAPPPAQPQQAGSQGQLPQQPVAPPIPVPSSFVFPWTPYQSQRARPLSRRDPWYPQGQQQTRMKRVPRRILRYGQASNYTHADFQRKIAENPKDITAHLVYADWLRENGQTGMADAIQHWANPDLWVTPARADIHPKEPWFFSEDTRGEHPSGRFRAGAWIPAKNNPARPIVNIFARSLADPSKDIQWYVPMPSREEARRIERQINLENPVSG